MAVQENIHPEGRVVISTVLYLPRIIYLEYVTSRTCYLVKVYCWNCLVDIYLHTKYEEDPRKFFSWPIIGTMLKVTWFGNSNRYQKSVLTDFRYCPIIQFHEVKIDPGNKMAEEIDFENSPKMPKSTLWGSRDLDLEVIWPS